MEAELVVSCLRDACGRCVGAHTAISNPIKDHVQQHGGKTTHVYTQSNRWLVLHDASSVCRQPEPSEWLFSTIGLAYMDRSTAV